MLKNKRLSGQISLSFILILHFQVVYSEPMQEHTLKAALTLNLIRFTEWPTTHLAESSPEVNLCVIANYAIEQAFLKHQAKSIINKQLNVEIIRQLGKLDHCHLLYINHLPKNKVIQLLKKLQKKSILTIGEEDYFTQHGGIVTLKMLQGKMEILININMAKQTGLHISSRVLKLATIVESTQ